MPTKLLIFFKSQIREKKMIKRICGFINSMPRALLVILTIGAFPFAGICQYRVVAI